MGAGARLAPRLLAALAAVAGALVVGEVAVRVTLAARGTPWSAADARERVRRMEREVGGTLGLDVEPQEGALKSLVLHPYFGYDSANVERSRDRAVELLSGPHEDVIYVVLVGGSVAALFNSADEGGVRELERLVAADPRSGGRAVRVLGHARPGYKAPQQLHAVAELLRRGAAPDLVLNLDGFNEIALALHNRSVGMPMDWPSHAHWLRVSSPPARGEELERLIDAEVARRAFLAESGRTVASPRLRSAILGGSALARLGRLQERTRAALDAYAEERRGAPPAEVDASAALPEAVDVWARSSALCAELCAGRGVRYVHALQPTLHDRGSKPVTAAEERDGLRGGWDENVLAGYPLLRAAGAELRERGVAFHDVSDAFRDVEETLYYDACHFDRRGNRILAARLAEALCDEL